VLRFGFAIVMQSCNFLISLESNFKVPDGSGTFFLLAYVSHMDYQSSVTTGGYDHDREAKP